MDAHIIVRVAGIILMCVGIFFGLSGILPLIVFGAGCAMLFLP